MGKDSQSKKFISTISISKDFNGHKIIVGTRDGTGSDNDNFQIMDISNFDKWNIQNTSVSPSTDKLISGDIITAKFSPRFDTDSTVIVVYSNSRGTFLATGTYDKASNSIAWQNLNQHIEIHNPEGQSRDSPRVNEIITADLELPSDFLGNTSNLRHFYVSTDAIDRVPGTSPNRGLYHIHDQSIKVLKNNTSLFGSVTAKTMPQRIASISYYGTCDRGKILIGEVLGLAYKSSVDTKFHDLPRIKCDETCWLSAKKTPSGAVRQPNYDNHTLGYGNAKVIWSPVYSNQGVAYAATGAASLGPWSIPNVVNGAVVSEFAWPAGYVNVIPSDESAFSLTRNNSETWNQLSLINTCISKLTDVAPSRDCSTVYLASINNYSNSQGFCSIWRSSSNEKVVAPPLPALSIGQIWERIFISCTCVDDETMYSNWAILRLAPDKLDGQVLSWAAGGTSGQSNIGGFPVGKNTKAMAWSPDFGDYWANISPSIDVQDFAFESSTILYILDINGNIQKLPYTGTQWANLLEVVSTMLGGGHTIEAMAPDKILIGNSANNLTRFPISFSLNGGISFKPFRMPLPESTDIGYHAIFDTDYYHNSTIYVANDDKVASSIWRNSAPYGLSSYWIDMFVNRERNPHTGFKGIAQSSSKNVTGQGTIYGAYFNGIGKQGGIERTLTPLDGIPFPGILWDCLDLPSSSSHKQAVPIEFSIEPKSLRLCGCLTQDTNTTIFAIDNNWYASNHNIESKHGGVVIAKDRGMLWAYTDCIAKKGPKLTMANGLIIGRDDVTGRNQQIDFTWEPHGFTTQYQIQIAKDINFSLMVVDTEDKMPPSVTQTALIYLAGGIATLPETVKVPPLECGQTYYWRCRARKVVSGQKIVSPWSQTYGFTVGATDSKMASVEMHYHVFIAHAAEDKDSAKSLYIYLKDNGLEVCYRDFDLRKGDSLTAEIKRGLDESWNGIIILSPNFFNKGFHRREFDALYNVEMLVGRTAIIPIRHNINKAAVIAESAFFTGSADRPIYDSAEMTIDQISKAISSRIIKENPHIKKVKNCWKDSVPYQVLMDALGKIAEGFSRAQTTL